MSPPLLNFELLGELESRWRNQGAPLVARLQPGLATEAMDALTAPLGLRLPSEARVWWGWRNGVPSDVAVGDQREIGRGFEYLPLAEAVDHYRMCRAVAADAAGHSSDLPELSDPDFWWHPSWFPITVASNGGVVTCECSVDDGKPTPMRSINWDERTEEPGRAGAASFGEMVSWWLEAFDSGVWRYEAERGRWDYRWQLLDPARELTALV